MKRLTGTAENAHFHCFLVLDVSSRHVSSASCFFTHQEVDGPLGNCAVANSDLQSVRTRNLLLLFLSYQASDEVKTFCFFLKLVRVPAEVLNCNELYDS